jgi:hypothetical protein
VAVTKKYTNPLQVVATPEQRATIKEIADREQISQAAVIRDCIDMALESRKAGRKVRVPRSRQR